jgi:hypothetical protein
MSHVDAAIAAFVNRIIDEGPESKVLRNRLFSAGLRPDFIYSLKTKRQREFGAAKLVAALAACGNLEVVIEGRRKEGSEALRWVVRAMLEPSPANNPDAAVRRSVEAPFSEAGIGTQSSSLTPGRAVQLSLFGCLQVVESDEIEIQDFHVTRREPHRADIRVDVALRTRRTG